MVFIGDGYSDRCVLDHGPIHPAQVTAQDDIFAVRGSTLDRLLSEGGVPARRFDDLGEVAMAIFEVDSDGEGALS